jgi:hypothetical protein
MTMVVALSASVLSNLRKALPIPARFPVTRPLSNREAAVMGGFAAAARSIV